MSDRKKSTAGAAVDTNEQTLNNELREIARKVMIMMIWQY